MLDFDIVMTMSRNIGGEWLFHMSSRVNHKYLEGKNCKENPSLTSSLELKGYKTVTLLKDWINLSVAVNWLISLKRATEKIEV